MTFSLRTSKAPGLGSYACTFTAGLRLSQSRRQGTDVCTDIDKIHRRQARGDESCSDDHGTHCQIPEASVPASRLESRSLDGTRAAGQDRVCVTRKDILPPISDVPHECDCSPHMTRRFSGMICRVILVARSVNSLYPSLCHERALHVHKTS